MKRVLVIDDNANNVKLITFILRKHGYETIEAASGAEGIRLALEKRPDFILLDIQLPDMDGIQVLEKIRRSKTHGNIPIIAVTSYAMSGDRERFIEAGCTGYIEKPIDPDTVLEEIRKITGELT